MRSFIKKDLLIFWRDRNEVLVGLLLPVLLIIVLNFAFGELFNNDLKSSEKIQLAYVNQDDETEAIVRLKEKLESEATLGEEETKAVIEQASTIQPVQRLLDFLESEDLKDLVMVHKLEEASAVKKIKDGELDGMLIIPSGYTADSLYAAFTGESPAVPLIYKLEKETNNSSALYQIIEGYTDELNYQFAINEIAGASTVEAKLPKGGLEEIGAGKAFTMIQYFTVAMSGLFALFLVSSIATKTGVEIREQVFNRILLANTNPSKFLAGKMVSTICLVVLQMIFVMMASHFMFDSFADRTLIFWLGLAVMGFLYCLVMSALAAVFASILLRVKNLDAANGLFLLVTILFGTVGGGFVPIYMLPDWLQQVSEWTPNGLFLSMIADWIQFETQSSLVAPSMIMIGFFILYTMIGILMFPKRGKVQ